MPYEKPSKGNHAKITLKQHIYPAKLINEFCNKQALVEVKRIVNGSIFHVKPDNQLFCAKRIWDQRAEGGWMKSIEDQFHYQLYNISKNGTALNHLTITKYFLLWAVKSNYDKNPPPDLIINGIPPSGLTKEEEDIVESKHGAYIDQFGNIKSRFQVSILAQRDHDILLSQHQKTKWGLLLSKKRPFIVPKYCSEYLMLPITPYLVLAGNYGSGKLSPEDTLKINRKLISNEKDIIFSVNIGQAIG